MLKPFLLYIENAEKHLIFIRVDILLVANIALCFKIEPVCTALSIHSLKEGVPYFYNIYYVAKKILRL